MGQEGKQRVPEVVTSLRNQWCTHFSEARGLDYPTWLERFAMYVLYPPVGRELVHRVALAWFPKLADKVGSFSYEEPSQKSGSTRVVASVKCRIFVDDRECNLS